MALVVEDGSGLSNADSYDSLTNLSAYHTAHGNPASWSAASETEKESAARQATQFLDGRFGRRFDLQVRTNRELRTLILAFVDQMFQIMRALELVALIIAVLGVANTLIASVLDRTRELGILRAIGASRRQVRGAVLAEATLIGLSASLLGAPSGFLVSWLVLKVINVQVRGWAIPYHFAWWGLAQTALLVTAAAALAGVLPSNRATGVEPVVALRAE